MILKFPTKSLTWCKEANSQIYMSARASVLLELYDDTGVLIARRWDKNGGVYGENNHPSGSEINITENGIYEIKVYNLSLNKLPMQVIIYNSETTDEKNINTLPTGMVDGNGSVVNSSIKLHKTIIGGQTVTMRFKASSVQNNWWKLDCNCIFIDGNNEMTSTNPNDGVDYGANFFLLDYYSGNIRWNNPNIAVGNQIVLQNTETWATENGQAINYWYKSNINNNTMECSSIVNGTLFSTWGNASDGSEGMLINQPLESWELSNNTGFYLLKILKKDTDGSPLWFEVRGRDLFLQFPFANGITASMVSCLNGQDIGMSIDTTYNIPNGYIKDGNIYKKSNTLNCSNIQHLTMIGTWSNSPSTPFKAVKFVNTGSKPYLAQIVSETPLKFVLRGKNAASSTNLQGGVFTYASGVDSSVVNCLGGEDTAIGGLVAPTSFPMPPNYEIVNDIYQPIVGGGTTTTIRIPAKISGTCASEGVVLQFGYSYTANAPESVTNWIDAQGTKMLSTQAGETIEVTSGGEIFQYADFTLSSGTYYFYVRQKTNHLNVHQLTNSVTI